MRFFSHFYAAFLRFEFGGILSSFLCLFRLSLILKGFNIGQTHSPPRKCDFSNKEARKVLTVLPGACENGWLVIPLPACVSDLANADHSSSSRQSRKKEKKLLLGQERRQRLREERHQVLLEFQQYLYIFWINRNITGVFLDNSNYLFNVNYSFLFHYLSGLLIYDLNVLIQVIVVNSICCWKN